MVAARNAKDRPAESLQVSVRVGRCDTGSVVNATLGGAGTVSPSLASSSGEACNTKSLELLPPDRWGVIELAPNPEDSSCTADGTQRISCSLGARGTAQFNVSLNSSKDDLAYYSVPLCFSAPRVDGMHSWERAVVFSTDAPVPDGVLVLQQLRPTKQADKASCSVRQSCARGPLMQLAVLGRESEPSTQGSGGTGPAEGETDENAAGAASVTKAADIARAPVSVSLHLTQRSQASGYIVQGDDCADPSKATAQITIPVASSTSEPFSICTSQGAGVFLLDAFALKNPRLRIQTSPRIEIPDAIESARFMNAGNEAGEVHVQLCGGKTQPATIDNYSVSGLSVNPRGVYARSVQSDGGSSAAGALNTAGEGGGGTGGMASSTPSTSATFVVTSKITGQTCELEAEK